MLPRITLILTAALPLLGACASDGDKIHREVAAVVQDEGQRAKVVDAIQKGATPAQAMDKVANGPTHEKAGPQ